MQQHASHDLYERSNPESRSQAIRSARSSELPLLNIYLARERARRGGRDDALPLMRAAADRLFREGQLLEWGIPVTGALVQTLLDRGADGDLAEAQAAIERLAAAPTDDGLVIPEIWLLRLRGLLALARGDVAAYADFRDRYSDMARPLEFEGISPGLRRCDDGGPVGDYHWRLEIDHIRESRKLVAFGGAEEGTCEILCGRPRVCLQARPACRPRSGTGTVLRPTETDGSVASREAAVRPHCRRATVLTWPEPLFHSGS